jgi:hypothetical protein
MVQLFNETNQSSTALKHPFFLPISRFLNQENHIGRKSEAMLPVSGTAGNLTLAFVQ